ncbi:MAG: FecR domain-containing protein [Planctomycetota bacterium]|nr:FecR domain-containing protein [Planctomycetota bacterium]
MRYHNKSAAAALALAGWCFLAFFTCGAEEAPAPPAEKPAAKPEAQKEGEKAAVQPASKGDDFYAADPQAIGHVAALEGRATATAEDGAKRQLSVNDFLHLKETLNTGMGSKLLIEFRDGSSISLGAKAKLILDEFVYKPKDPESKCTTTLIKGAFKAIGGAISANAPDQMKIKTPTATIGIRGTTCVGEADSDKLVAIFMDGHAIAVTNDLGQTILDGEPGIGCVTRAGEAPGPRRMMLNDANRLMQNLMAAAARQAGAVGGAGRPPMVPPPVHHH